MPCHTRGFPSRPLGSGGPPSEFTCHDSVRQRTVGSALWPIISQQTFLDGHGHSARYKIRPHFSKDRLSEDGLAKVNLGWKWRSKMAWHTQGAASRSAPAAEMVSLPRSLVQGTVVDPTIWLLLLFFPTRYPGSSIDRYPGQPRKCGSAGMPFNQPELKRALSIMCRHSLRSLHHIGADTGWP